MPRTACNVDAIEITLIFFILYYYNKFHNEVVCTSENINDNNEGFSRKWVLLIVYSSKHRHPFSRKPFIIIIRSKYF